MFNGFNISTISDCYFGNTHVSEIYYESTKVWPLHDYSQDYLTFTALESGTFKFSKNALQYSVDNGSTWHNLPKNTPSPTVSAGSKIMWKQTGLTPGTTSGSFGIGTFSATCNFNASGNIMSLYYGDNFYGQTSLSGKTDAFHSLFYNCPKLINAENLILPATTLSEGCYFVMFQGCSSLITIPLLPATTMQQNCYRGIFQDCTSLTAVPQNLLPATTLAQYCYRSMFVNCTSLTSVPNLPATTLADDCYQYMFQNCAGLTAVPENLLPATTLTIDCYQYMFRGCSSLIKAPTLSATTLVNSCYQEMFKNCRSLNYIKCLATNISASNCTTGWVYNVAPTGTFVKDANMTSWTIGVNGIPTGWVVKDDYSQTYLTFTALESGTFKFAMDAYSGNALQYSLDNGSTWTTLPGNTASPTVSAGSKIMWKQTGLTPVIPPDVISSPKGIGKFSATGRFNASGNIMSLYYGDNFIGQKDLTGKDYAFYSLFAVNDKLVSAENLVLPATTLAESCYDGMFRRCSSLTTAPTILPANTLADYCYYGMFYECSSLTTTPELPATTLALACYRDMFSDCTSLTTAPELPATTLAEGCCENMFKGCTSLTTAPTILPATTLALRCYMTMFRNCTSLTTAPELPATTLANYCYNMMFYWCTSLNYIKCLATNKSATGCTDNWVKNVASTGTFVKSSSMSSWSSGDSGIPTNWTVQNA